jgi:NADP-dependent aldehyde dehydrogenase
MFGTATLVVDVAQPADMPRLLKLLHGNLTGAIYAEASAEDDALYSATAAVLRPKVGRMMNDKMPTGVVVSPAMQHGGPFPATGHAGFTSVGIPAALRRFAVLQCYDHVLDSRLPPALRNKNPNGSMMRSIDGKWTTADVA